MSLGEDSITWVKRTQAGTDAQKNPIWTTTTESISGVDVAPATPSEDLEVGRLANELSITIYIARQRPAIQRSDKVQWRGDDYEVVGVPQDWGDKGLVVTARLIKEG